MKKKEEGIIKIDLLPEDFVGNYYTDNTDCPLARAAKRHFGWEYGSCYSEELKRRNDKMKVTDLYSIINGFDGDDYDFVKEQYRKDPKAKNVIYYVEVIKR